MYKAGKQGFVKGLPLFNLVFHLLVFHLFLKILEIFSKPCYNNCKNMEI